MDIWSKEKRSEVMSKIHSRNTKPELALRKALFAKGFRFRVNYKRLPGKPDIVFPKYKTAIFVNGCFWHHHEGCRYAGTPSSNTEYWLEKFRKNKERDKSNYHTISLLGWNVIVVWECEIRHARDINPLVDSLVADLLAQAPAGKRVAMKIYDEVEGEVAMVAEDEVRYEEQNN